MKCIAAVAPAAKAPFVIEPIDVPEPAEDEVLVRIVARVRAPNVCDRSEPRRKKRRPWPQ